MLKTFWLIMAVWLAGLAWSAGAADTYSLADGTTLTGDIVTFTDAGIVFRIGDDKYTDRMPWTQFSQEGLRQLAQNPKIRPFVDPFMELPAATKSRPDEEIKVGQVSRLDRPAPESLLGALASSSVGLFLLFLIYAANLYAAFEIAACRGRPLPVVMGISAVAPLFGPAIFFALPTLQQYSEAPLGQAAEGEVAAAAAGTAAPAAAAAPSPGQPAAPAAPSSASSARHAGRAAPAAAAETPEAPVPQFDDIQVSAVPAKPKESPVSQVFKRGQFTFNRRFIETKFGGFLTPSRSEADKKLDFIVKIPQGEFVVQRISRVGTGDLDLEVTEDGQPKVILVPFADIQEINIKSKTV